MASRMKKIFHRSKDSDAEQSPQRTRESMSDRSEPALPSSRYESMAPGQRPQTGDYPVKGNDTSIILQQGRKSSLSRSRRNSGTFENVPYQSTTPNQYNTAKHPPHMTSPPIVVASNDPYQQSQATPTAGHDGRRRYHPQGSSGLNMASTTVTQTVTTTRTPHQGHNTGRGTLQNHGNASGSAPQERVYSPSSNAVTQHQEHLPRSSNNSQFAARGDIQRHDYPSIDDNTPQIHESASRNSTTSQMREHVQRDNASIKPVNERESQRVSMPQPSRGDLSSNPGPKAYDSSNLQDGDDAVLARHNSIPRKQIGTSASTPHSSLSRAPVGQIRQQHASKPLPSTPASADREYTDHYTDSAHHPSHILNRSRPISTNQTGLPDAQSVVDRAKTNTYDTEVVEFVAPAVVHEKVHNAVHHVREEMITREIHTHDVYHRIQPIVDVEVLPPRHFLPVEGGGLVEVSAQEVPGRGSNWVIAETASKIPSDQAAPPGRTQFTARNFAGREGDAVNYISPEGHEVTEQTWVHHPELEEGARLTGQSWPMVINGEAPGKGEHGSSGAHGFSTPKTTKTKGPKNNPAFQASPAQRAGGASGRA